jgi:hypothetical protein
MIGSPEDTGGLQEQPPILGSLNPVLESQFSTAASGAESHCTRYSVSFQHRYTTTQSIQCSRVKSSLIILYLCMKNVCNVLKHALVGMKLIASIQIQTFNNNLVTKSFFFLILNPSRSLLILASSRIISKIWSAKSY